MSRWTIVRKGACRLTLAALLCLALAACASATSRSSATGGSTAVAHAPTVTSHVAVTGPVSSVVLTCTTRTTSGSEEDQVQQVLSCSVTNAPSADTQFALSYSIRSPAGTLHPFTQTCSGALHAGAGTCSQTYTFIVPYAPLPGPVSGESSPSHHTLGPVTPTAA